MQIWEHFTGDEWPEDPSTLGIPDAALQILMDQRPRPSIHQFEEGQCIVLRAINFHFDTPHEMLSLRCFLTESKLITFSSFSLRSVQETLAVKAEFESVHDVFTSLLNNIYEKISEFIHDLEDKTDDLECASASAAETSCSGMIIKEFLTKCAYVRRFSRPQHDVLNTLMSQDAFADILQLQNRSLRDLEVLELTRERLSLLVNDAHIQSNEQLNQRMYLLTIITVVFASASLLAGVFGMNVGGVPLQRADGFWSTLALITGLSGLTGVIVYRFLK